MSAEHKAKIAKGVKAYHSCAKSKGCGGKKKAPAKKKAPKKKAPSLGSIRKDERYIAQMTKMGVAKSVIDDVKREVRKAKAQRTRAMKQKKK